MTGCAELRAAYRIYGLHEKLEEYEGRMEAMGIEVNYA